MAYVVHSRIPCEYSACEDFIFLLLMQVYHPNIYLEGMIDTGLYHRWRPRYHDITFLAYVLLNLFEEPSPLCYRNFEASEMMRENVKVFDSLVSHSLAGETLTLDCSFEGETVKQVHNFVSQREMNAVRPDPSWTQLFPHNVCVCVCVCVCV